MADRERQARNKEWQCLHESGSQAVYEHSSNCATQLVSEGMTMDNDNELLTLEWSKDTEHKMQTEALDENKKESMGKSLHSDGK
jgi:arabinogalactan endo-1,4-beta-galactosidase